MGRRFQFDEWKHYEWKHDEWEEDGTPNRPIACVVCEAMCPDAVDGTLSEAERKAFDKHVAGCTRCAQELEDAQRGAAWLGLLKSKAPEPPATLLARILSETGAVVEPLSASSSASAATAMQDVHLDTSAPIVPLAFPAAPAVQESPVAVSPARNIPFLVGKEPSSVTLRPHNDQGSASSNILAQENGKVLPFRRKVQMWIDERGVPALHPRLAMTAAMAFFSIALTLNLTGVRLSDLRAEDLRPATLERTAANAQATAVRSFQNLRVVYQVESRVSELRQDPLWTDGFNANKKTRSLQQNDGSDSPADGRGRN